MDSSLSAAKGRTSVTKWHIPDHVQEGQRCDAVRCRSVIHGQLLSTSRRSGFLTLEAQAAWEGLGPLKNVGLAQKCRIDHNQTYVVGLKVRRAL